MSEDAFGRGFVAGWEAAMRRTFDSHKPATKPICHKCGRQQFADPEFCNSFTCPFKASIQRDQNGRSLDPSQRGSQQ